MARNFYCRIVYNHFPRIEVRLKSVSAEITKETLEDTVDIAKQIVPVDTGSLRDSIAYEMDGPSSGVAFADKEYAQFVEYGTIHMGPQPFMTPAGEAARSLFYKRFRELEKRLR